MIGKKKIHSLPKMIYMHTLGTLIMDQALVIQNAQPMISKKTQLNMNLFLSLKYTALPPSPENSQNGGGTPAEQPAVNNEEPQTIRKNHAENENLEPTPETSRKPENAQEIPSQSSPETPANNPEIDAQEAG